MTSNPTTISEIQFRPIKPQDGLVGFVSFVIDGKFWMGSVGVYARREGGYRLIYPTRKIAGQNIDVFHPINREVGSLVEAVVSEKVSEIFSEDYDSVEPETGQ